MPTWVTVDTASSSDCVTSAALKSPVWVMVEALSDPLCSVLDVLLLPVWLDVARFCAWAPRASPNVSASARRKRVMRVSKAGNAGRRVAS